MAVLLVKLEFEFEFEFEFGDDESSDTTESVAEDAEPTLLDT